MSRNNIVKTTEKITEEINIFENAYLDIIRGIQVEDEDHSLRIHKADWFVRGSFYHLKNICRYYKTICEELSSRVGSIIDSQKRPPDYVIMYSPEIQYLYFELYSLVNLTRISFDNLLNILSPTFSTSFENLPKSITQFLKGETNCPIYFNLEKNEVLEYLIDLRNCIVHYRSFATSDNSLAILEGSDIPAYMPKWFTRISYRQKRESEIVVNIFLPDQIFTYNKDGVKILPPFTFERKNNILSQCREFVLLCMSVTIESIKLLVNYKSKDFFYRKI